MWWSLKQLAPLTKGRCFAGVGESRTLDSRLWLVRVPSLYLSPAGVTAGSSSLASVLRLDEPIQSVYRVKRQSGLFLSCYRRTKQNGKTILKERNESIEKTHFLFLQIILTKSFKTWIKPATQDKIAHKSAGRHKKKRWLFWGRR